MSREKQPTRAELPLDGSTNARTLGVLQPDQTHGGTITDQWTLINTGGKQFDGSVVRIAAVGGDVYYAVNAQADSAEAVAYLPEGAIEYIYISRLEGNEIFTALGISAASTGTLNYVRMI